MIRNLQVFLINPIVPTFIFLNSKFSQSVPTGGGKNRKVEESLYGYNEKYWKRKRLA